MKTWIKAGEQRPMRRFVLYLGNPLVKYAAFQAYSEEEAWDHAKQLYGTNKFWPDARLNAVMEEPLEGQEQ